MASSGPFEEVTLSYLATWKNREMRISGGSNVREGPRRERDWSV